MTSLRTVILCLVALLCVACSSAPDRHYQVHTYQLLADSWMKQADRKRQQEQYDEALRLYAKALDYAQRRNDTYNMGLARLKSAVVYLELGKTSQAQTLVAEVEQQNRYEPVPDLDNAILFVRAKRLHVEGNNGQARTLLAKLESHYRDDAEKSLYYRLVGWSYGNDAVSITQVEADIAVLDKLVADGKLKNIEIYSFALYRYAKWLVEHDDDRAAKALDKAITHFSSLELTAKIKACYRLSAQFYRARGQTEKADYLLGRIKAMN